MFKTSNASEDTVVTIGNVSKKVKSPKNPELVPRKYLPKEIPRETLKDLKWMMQKGMGVVSPRNGFSTRTSVPVPVPF